MIDGFSISISCLLHRSESYYSSSESYQKFHLQLSDFVLLVDFFVLLCLLSPLQDFFLLPICVFMASFVLIYVLEVRSGANSSEFLSTLPIASLIIGSSSSLLWFACDWSAGHACFMCRVFWIVSLSQCFTHWFWVDWTWPLSSASSVVYWVMIWLLSTLGTMYFYWVMIWFSWFGINMGFGHCLMI